MLTKWGDDLQELMELNITMGDLAREERFDEFFNLFDPTVSLALEEQNFTILIDLYWTRGSIFYQLGNIQSCISDLKTAAEWIDDYGTPHQIIKYLNSCGTAYGELGHQEKYIEYLNKAKKLALELNDISSLCNIDNNLSVYYIEVGQAKEAVKLLQDCIERSELFYKENGIHVGSYLHLRLNLAHAYTELGQYELAEDLFNFMFSYIEGKQMIKSAIYVYHYKGIWYEKQGYYEEACQLLELAKEYALKNDDLIQLEEINKTLLKLMEVLGDKNRLIELQNDYIQILLKLKDFNLNQNLMQMEFIQNIKHYKEMTIRDPLTNCYNLRYIAKYGKKLAIESSTTNQLVGCLIFDIDYFKEINDNLGHLAGDDALKQIAKEADQFLSNYEGILARYGGDEFIAIIKVSSKGELTMIIEKLHRHLSTLKIEINNQIVPIQVSIGASTNEFGQLTDEIAILKKADQALYISKENGRNQFAISY